MGRRIESREWTAEADRARSSPVPALACEFFRFSKVATECHDIGRDCELSILRRSYCWGLPARQHRDWKYDCRRNRRSDFRVHARFVCVFGLVYAGESVSPVFCLVRGCSRRVPDRPTAGNALALLLALVAERPGKAYFSLLLANCNCVRTMDSVQKGPVPQLTYENDSGRPAGWISGIKSMAAEKLCNVWRSWTSIDPRS